MYLNDITCANTAHAEVMMTADEINDKVQKMGATKVREEGKRLGLSGKSLSGMRTKVAAALFEEQPEESCEDMETNNIPKSIRKLVKLEGDELTFLIAEDDVKGLSDKKVKAFLGLFGAEEEDDIRSQLISLLREADQDSEETSFSAGDKVIVRNDETGEDEEGVIADLSEYDDDDQPEDGFIRVEDADEAYEDVKPEQLRLPGTEATSEAPEDAPAEAVEEEPPCSDDDGEEEEAVSTASAAPIAVDLAVMSKEDLRGYLTAAGVKFRKNAVEAKLRELAARTLIGEATAEELLAPVAAPVAAPAMEASPALERIATALERIADSMVK